MFKSLRPGERGPAGGPGDESVIVVCSSPEASGCSSSGGGGAGDTCKPLSRLLSRPSGRGGGVREAEGKYHVQGDAGGAAGGGCSLLHLCYGSRLSPDDTILCSLFPVQHFLIYQLFPLLHRVLPLIQLLVSDCWRRSFYLTRVVPHVDVGVLKSFIH